MNVSVLRARRLTDGELEEVSGGIWPIVLGVALASSIPISGLLILDAKIQEWKDRGRDGPSCPVE